MCLFCIVWNIWELQSNRACQVLEFLIDELENNPFSGTPVVLVAVDLYVDVSCWMIVYHTYLSPEVFAAREKNGIYIPRDRYLHEEAEKKVLPLSLSLSLSLSVCVRARSLVRLRPCADVCLCLLIISCYMSGHDRENGALRAWYGIQR